MVEGSSTSGGFTGQNTGSITDCYCIYTSNIRGHRKCFAGKSTGVIKTSFANDRGTIIQQWNGKGVPFNKQIRSAEGAFDSGFDTKHLWEYTGGKYILQFNETTWFTTEGIPAMGKPVFVRSAKDLEQLSKLINSGDKRYANAYIKLKRDIDCKGKRIKPIGDSRANAFCGVFDGSGFTIRNYKVESSSIGNLGFFGYLCGTVINLSVDCIVKGEGNIGGLCGVNDGKIICCGVICSLNGNGDRLNMGGLAGQNFGAIERSYAAVSIKRRIIPLLPIGVAAAVMASIGGTAFVLIPAPSTIYATVITDKNQIKVEDDTEKPQTTEEMNTVSFRFNETLHIDPETGNCYINFKNPSYDKNKIVVTLEASGDVGDGEIMARSGAVDPGYGLDYIRLTERGYELINSGVRTGNIIVEGYDVVNNDKAMIDSKLPVHISIERGDS